MKNITNFIAKNKVMLLCFCLFNLWLQTGIAQNNTIYFIPDSLKNKTYKELYKAQDLFYNDTIKYKIYANAYLHKAKNENDTIKMANAYTQFGSITENAKYAIKYYDSIIDLTKNLTNDNYPGFAYMVKGMCNYELGNYEESLDNYLEAHKYANKYNNIGNLLLLKNNIGNLKNFWGKYKEAIEYYKTSFDFLEKNKNENLSNYHFLYYNTLSSISDSYIYLNKLDSAAFYTNKGLRESLSKKDFTHYYNFVFKTGEIAYYQNNYQQAIDSLKKAISFENSSNGLLNYHYYRGNIYWKEGDDKNAFKHFKKADSIYNLTKDVVPEVRDIQEFFVTYYKNNNDVKNQLKYLNKLLYVDSIINSYRKNLNESIIKKYDTPLLIAEKEKIIHSLNNKTKKSSLLIVVLIGILSIATYFGFKSYKKQKVYKKRFDELINSSSKKTSSKSNNKNTATELTEISKDIVDLILSKLNDFEDNHNYINNDITLNSLSKSIGTNSSYLSKVINFYKDKNFSNYISDLRIDYCVNKLKIDLTFRKYGIKAIASEVGFNNTESFSKAFYKKTGIYPSYFINNLNE